MFGIGLDDAFIIFGAYGRTNPSKDALERIHDTIEGKEICVLPARDPSGLFLHDLSLVKILVRA